MTVDGDNRDKRDEEGLPEVEAELVSETPPAADAFEDDAPEDSPPPDADAGEKAKAAVKSGRPSTLTPGVMLFLGFAVVALIAFAAWRMQPKPASENAPKEAAAPVAETPAETAAPSPAAQDPIEDSPAPAAKIQNDPVDNMKRAPDQSAGVEPGYLPPVTEEAGSKISNSVEEGAKEAMRRFRESEDAAAAGALADQDNTDTDQPAGFEIAPEPAATGEDEAAAETQASVAEPASEESAATAAVIETPPLAADIEAARAALLAEFAGEKQQLEAALAAERQRADNEANESARLRAALDAAVQRDAQAQEELAALRASLDQLRSEDANASDRQMKATFALAALSRAIDQGDPYTEELSVMADFVPQAQGALGAHAETGVASEPALRSRFDSAARAALAAAAQEMAGGGLAGVMARAQNIISVRPAEPASGDEPGAVLSRADHALEQGEVAFALLQLEDLPLVAQEAMADWIADARARAEAESALAALSARIAGETD